MTLPSFEVASVRASPTNVGNTSFGPFGENRFSVSNASLSLLVQLAFGVPYEQIEGLDKLGPERYEVSVKADDGVLLTSEQLQPRMQRLLQDRFQLAWHAEKKDFDGYALVVAKGGLKLSPAAGASEGGTIYPGGLRLLNMPLSSFANTLRSTAGRPVVDKTGIEGNYDFTLNYAREGDADSPLPSFFTALQETLGLKLEPLKVSLELVVIDHLEKTPTEN